MPMNEMYMPDNLGWQQPFNLQADPNGFNEETRKRLQNTVQGILDTKLNNDMTPDQISKRSLEQYNAAYGNPNDYNQGKLTFNNMDEAAVDWDGGRNPDLAKQVAAKVLHYTPIDKPVEYNPTLTNRDWTERGGRPETGNNMISDYDVGINERATNAPAPIEQPTQNTYAMQKLSTHPNLNSLTEEQKKKLLEMYTKEVSNPITIKQSDAYQKELDDAIKKRIAAEVLPR